VARAVARLFFWTANASISQRSDPVFGSSPKSEGACFDRWSPPFGEDTGSRLFLWTPAFFHSWWFCPQPGQDAESVLAQGPWRTRDAESRVGPVDSEPAQGSGPRGSRRAGQRPAFEGTGRAQARLSVFARQSNGSPQAKEQWLGRTQGPPPTKWCHLPGQPGTNWERWTTSDTVCSQGPLTANQQSQR
jgi:hypothetical protein